MNLIVVYIAASSSSLQNFINDPFVQDLFAKHVTNATSMASPSSSQFFFLLSLQICDVYDSFNQVSKLLIANDVSYIR